MKDFNTDLVNETLKRSRKRFIHYVQKMYHLGLKGVLVSSPPEATYSSFDEWPPGLTLPFQMSANTSDKNSILCSQASKTPTSSGRSNSLTGTLQTSALQVEHKNFICRNLVFCVFRP